MLPERKFKLSQKQVIRSAIAFLILLSLGLLIPAIVRLDKDTATVHKTPTEENKREFDVSLERVKTTVGGIGTIATIAGGIVLFLNFKVAQDKQITERFSKAVEQLGSDKIEVRLGGIYSLERIAKDSPADHWTIMEVLSAFIREQLPLTPKKQSQPNFAESFLQSQKTEDKLTQLEFSTDIRAALTVIERRESSQDPEDSRIALLRTNFSQTNLWGVKLQEVDLRNANFEKTLLQETCLQGADLSNANFQEAWLAYANLQGANLWLTNLQEAFLAEANLQTANLWNANLKWSHLINANLQQANLMSANLQGAALQNANLNDSILLATDLRNTNNLTIDQLIGDNPPLLCGVALPSQITDIDPNRDCDQMPQRLVERFGYSLEEATQIVDEARQKQWD